VRLLRLALLAVVLGTTGVVGFVSYERVQDQLAALETCDAARTGDWARALARSEGRVGADATGRAAAECRCLALLATEAGDACVELLDAILADPEAADWAPGPALAVHLIQTRRDAGRIREAAELARRAARAHPDDPDLFYLELVTRGSVEDEALVLRELESRLTGRRPRELRMRTSLANRYLMRGDPGRALAVLGDLRSPDVEDPDDVARWFDTRAMAFAWSGDLEGVRRTHEAWRRAGGDPVELRARYALTLSIAGLGDPDHSPIELLEDALATADALDPGLHEALVIRLVLTLVNAGRLDEALAAYDRGRERFELAGLTRAELERAVAHQRLAVTPLNRRRGRLRFAIPDAESGSRLLLSPEPSAPADADYEALAIPASGRVSARRSFGIAPQRWVLRDAGGRVRGSGTVSPVPGADVEVEVALRPPSAPLHASLERRAGDGRRRVALVLLDCADWRLVQYLRARGELPFLDALLEGGHRAVLTSDPPLTAAALEAIVSPGRPGAVSFVGLVHQLGVELAGLASIGDNPAAALAWLLPERDDLFARLGAGDLSAANLLFAHGGIRAGRHSEVTGPAGRRRRLALATSERDLDAEERERWPALAAVTEERDRIHLRTIAAEFDTAERILGEGEIDLLALRIEPLDILTHAHFARAVRDGQDDGEALLFSVYRYIDARLVGVHARLDGDDVLIVMSDHGIRTAMEHSRDAIFVMAGPGIAAGRTGGSPALRGVPRVLADLLGVATDWPDTGIAPRAAVAAAGAPLAAPGATADPSSPLAAR
jgi:tetratricopeptide (TPR) repeat protein